MWQRIYFGLHYIKSDFLTVVEHCFIPVWTVGRVILVIGIDKKTTLIQEVLVSGHVMNSDNRKSHLTSPRAHDVGNAVAVSGRFFERRPQLRHFSVAELELVDVALNRPQHTTHLTICQTRLQTTMGCRHHQRFVGRRNAAKATNNV